MKGPGNPNHRILAAYALSGCCMETTMKRHLLAVLGATAALGLAAGSAAAWDDSYRDCPGSRGCLSAYYSPTFHRGPYYRPLPPVWQYSYVYGGYYVAGRRGGCVKRGYRWRCH
jgi:hypothetical protein